MKKALIAAIILLLLAIAVGGYFLLDHMFPVASPIDCPNKEDIRSISLTQNSDPSTSVDVSDFEAVLQNICAGEPTRIWSIQDYPSVESYYTVELNTLARQYRYFVYADGSQVYVEKPYHGVYKVDQQVLDFFADYFRN